MGTLKSAIGRRFLTAFLTIDNHSTMWDPADTDWAHLHDHRLQRVVLPGPVCPVDALASTTPTGSLVPFQQVTVLVKGGKAHSGVPSHGVARRARVLSQDGHLIPFRLTSNSKSTVSGVGSLPLEALQLNQQLVHRLVPTTGSGIDD
ncbi:hypothetical protein TYRP_001619 [Tyrophagus putrescentiae]|nr:hypothetical protein TYRP_001619 [Tyrophagus putrescentiae]